MEDFIQDLNNMIVGWKKYLEQTKAVSSVRITEYENTLKSKNVSETEKLRALVGRIVEYDHLDNLLSDLIILQ